MNLKEYIKDHRKEIFFGAVVLSASVVGGVIVYRNRESIKNALTKHNKKKVIPAIEHSTSKIIETTAPKIKPIPKEITENLTGRMLTARKLAREALCSDREINKRLCDKGLQVKSIWRYDVTELGSKLGVEKWKTTYSGYDYRNNEWDIAVLRVLFTPEELEEIAKKKMLVADVFGTYAA